MDNSSLPPLQLSHRGHQSPQALPAGLRSSSQNTKTLPPAAPQAQPHLPPPHGSLGTGHSLTHQANGLPAGSKARCQPGGPRCPLLHQHRDKTLLSSPRLWGTAGAEDTGTSAEGTGLSEKQKGSIQAVQADSQTRQEQGKIRARKVNGLTLKKYPKKIIGFNTKEENRPVFFAGDTVRWLAKYLRLYVVAFCS